MASLARDAPNAYDRFQLGGDLFFFLRYLLNVRIDQDLSWAQLVSACHLIFHNVFLLQKNKILGSCHWLVVLSMEPARFRQSSSCAKVTDASSDLGCGPWSIHQPRPLYQTGEPASAGGVHIRRGGLLRHVAILNIRSQWQDSKFPFFVIRVYYEKLGYKLKP